MWQKRSSHSVDRAQRFKIVPSVQHNERRHYWGQPNKNFGFYTSEQLEELAERSRRVKTESVITKQYEQRDQGKFIIDTQNNSYVHCCTCHNNPKRYVNGVQRCNFCKQYQQKKSIYQLPYFTKQENPQDELFEQPLGYTFKAQKSVQDEAIQVQLKLPQIYLNKGHNSKKRSNCQACKEKATNKKAKTPQIKNKKQEMAGGESLMYSPSTKKKVMSRF